MLALLAAALAATPPSFAAEPSIVVEVPAGEVAVAKPADDSEILDSSVAWWEKITVTVDDKGKQHSCRYEASLSGEGAKACDKAMAASVEAGSSGQAGVLSKVTFERRFSPGGRVDSGQLQPGDTLLGRQVMYLTFDADGAVESCKVVAVSGDTPPTYNCDAAKKEQFRAQASADAGAARQAFLTILAYGHTEEIV
ncbi:hypothetical protein LZ496_05460 [Sphingomonas sp. NSE70-1]|uniref:Uncharacterized protein n=1 Tax=Sphingomonas caseinilyticus TaxID=2908205 RepID=A0ABT0RTA0_9SPHN|nr:hypothetical protein [Sphingomonas caseinilyticus]MCL6698229.1 hypothetical protein [Sphingomonas caseinilyticus]